MNYKELLYDVLLEGDVEQIDKFAHENFGHSLTGEEFMDIFTPEDCGHCHMFESLSTDSVRLWLSTESCDCEDEEEMVQAGIYPMHVAVKTANVSLIDYLMDSGCSVNVESAYHKLTPFYVYFYQRDEQAVMAMIRILEERRLDMHQTSIKGTSLLHMCAYKGYAEVMEFIIEKTTDLCLNAQTNHKKSPLLCATMQHHYKCVKILVDNGADVNVTDQNGITPLYCAVRNGHNDIAQLLMNSSTNCDVNMKPYQGYRSMSALHIAIQQDDENLVKILLEHGADASAKADSDLTPLMFTAYMNIPNVAKLLIEHKADVNLTNVHGYAPLHNAVWDGHEELVKIFLNANALHDVRALDGNTPLSLSCHGGQWPITSLLLTLGCTINNPDKDFDMPLHYAAYNGCVQSVEALLQHNALPDVPNRLAATPLWNAAYRAHPNVVHLLLRYNPDMSIKSCGIQQESQNQGVTECFSSPKSILYAACKGSSEKQNLDTLKVLVCAGLKLNQELWLYENDHPSCMNDTVMAWIIERASQPPSLLLICRVLIRDILRGVCNLQDQVAKMELPYTVKRYLTTQDL